MKKFLLIVLMVVLSLAVFGEVLSRRIIANWVLEGLEIISLESLESPGYLTKFSIGKTEMVAFSYVKVDSFGYIFSADTDTRYILEVMVHAMNQSGLNDELKEKLIKCIVNFKTSKGFSHDGKYYDFGYSSEKGFVSFIFGGGN
jgi:hypothetical protein